MHIAEPMPNGVTVAQLILVQFVEVRILIGQPFSFFPLLILPCDFLFLFFAFLFSDLLFFVRIA